MICSRSLQRLLSQRPAKPRHCVCRASNITLPNGLTIRCGSVRRAAARRCSPAPRLRASAFGVVAAPAAASSRLGRGCRLPSGGGPRDHVSRRIRCPRDSTQSAGLRRAQAQSRARKARPLPHRHAAALSHHITNKPSFQNRAAAALTCLMRMLTATPNHPHVLSTPLPMQPRVHR